MRGKSHICLGKYLIEHYMEDIGRFHQKLFLIGCIQPDRNPLTYLKGSFRFQLLRGHNYNNARRFMQRISIRLEQRDRLKIYDYYTLGKLIHYTADAFTSAHNASFPDSISDHKVYEAKLQEDFLSYLQQDPQVHICPANSIMESIGNYHREYTKRHFSVHRDCAYALQACCCVLAVLISRRIL